MTCPVCQAENITAAHILAHGGKGKPKVITPETRRIRSEWMTRMNAIRAKKKTNDLALPASPGGEQQRSEGDSNHE